MLKLFHYFRYDYATIFKRQSVNNNKNANIYILKIYVIIFIYRLNTEKKKKNFQILLKK